jgi:TP901 family phage tail tape measure protein
MAEGTITRKDIITDDALRWGDEYAKTLNDAIAKNREFVDSIILLNAENVKLRRSENQTEFIKQKNEVKLLAEKSISSIKEQLVIETSLEKIKRDQINTSKLNIELDVKKIKAQKEINVLDVENEKLNQQKLKTQKDQVALEQQLNKLSIEKEKLQREGLNTDKARIQSIIAEEKLKKEQLSTLKNENSLQIQGQQLIKSNLDIKSKELRIIAQEQAASKASIKLTVEERLANEQKNRAEKEQAILSSKLTTAYTKLNLQRTIAKKNLLDLLSAENQNTEAIKKAQIEFYRLDVRVRKADHAVGDFHKTVGNYPKIQSLTNGLKNLVGAFGLVGGIALFASIMKNAFDTIKQFDQALAGLSAITGATGKDLDYLKNQAIELGKGTKGGAVAVVEAYKLIASAKPELLENVNALNQVTEAVLTLAQASGMEMPDAATALTDAMNQFGADASQATVFVDALANGAKYGAAEIPQVTEALLKFGAVARTSNVSIQESTALIELLAENGLKGADAGTALRNVLLKISAPDALPRRAQEEFARLGISLETLKDKSIPIQQKLELLKPLLKDNASIVKVFGLENATAALNVLGHTERLKELTSKMNENGTATEQANIRMDTLTGSIDKLESAWGSFVLSLSEKGNAGGSFLKFWVNDAIETLSMLDDWFTTSAQKRERELAAIRKEGVDSAIKNYADKNKRSLEDLQNVIAWNNAEIAENTRAALELEKVNKKIAADDSFFNSGKRKKMIEDNQKKIAALNNKTTFAGAENATVKGFIQQRTAKPLAPEANSDTGINSKAEEKAAKEALDRAKKLSDSLYELQKQRLERTIKINSEIASDEKLSDEVRIAGALNSQKKQVELAELTKKHSLDADKFVLDKDKLSSNEKIRIKEEAANKIVDIEKKTVEEIDKIKVFDEAKYQKELEDKVSKLNVAQNAELQAENEKFAALGDLEAMAQADREKAIEDHEKRIFEIKKKYAIDALKLQIKNLESELAASDALPAIEQISADKRQKIAETLSKAKLDLSEVELSTNKDKNEKEVLSEQEKVEKILEISSDITGALADLSNAFSERKIAKIDEEIAKNDEYYSKQIELAGNDQRQKDLLQKEQEKKRDELEKKKRKEQDKQAKFDKAITIAQIAIQTALAVMKAAPAIPMMVMAAVAGAISLATAIATPIPKYKMGRKGGPAETAWVGDGGVNEVITNARGLNPRLTPNIPTLTHLNEDDIVHKSMADYQAYMRASVLSGLQMDGRRMDDFQAMQNEEKYGKESLAVMKETLSVLKKQKNGSIINMPGLDINHHLWKMKNTNWS